MASIIKFSGYYIDPNGDYSANDVKVDLEEHLDLISHHIEVHETNLGEWDDDNVLNRSDCPKIECEKHFGIIGTYKPGLIDIMDIKAAIKKGKMAIKVVNGNILIGYPSNGEWVKIGEEAL